MAKDTKDSRKVCIAEVKVYASLGQLIPICTVDGPHVANGRIVKDFLCDNQRRVSRAA